MTRAETAIAEPVLNDGFRSYQLGHAALREKGVRDRRFAPQSPQEARWRAEGPRPVDALDSVRQPPWEGA